MYKILVEAKRSALGSLFKTAWDLAVILDHPATQIKKIEPSVWNGPLEERIRAFNLLCAVFVKANLEPPAMEEALWRASLPHIWDAKKHEQARQRMQEVRSTVHKRLKGKNKYRVAFQARALMETLMLFPECEGYNKINMANIMAMLNYLLVDELLLDPIRPDYAQMTVPNPISSGPNVLSCVLIVDDSVPELMRSSMALAGVPNITVQFLHYAPQNAYNKLNGEALGSKLVELAKTVIETQSDIVLMDQGLGNIEGSQLVETIRSLGGKQPFFVANTGGDPEAFQRVGCYENFDKGNHPRAMAMAIKTLDLV